MPVDASVVFEDTPQSATLLTSEILRDPYTFLRNWIEPPTFPLPSMADEAESVRTTKPLEVSDEGGTMSVTELVDRHPFIPLLQAIMKKLWEVFQLPNKNGLDIGSGPQGIMARQLLPDTINRGDWTQLELNPNSCRTNRALGSTPVVREGSYQDLSFLNQRVFDLVTGLSTLDATLHQENAIRQIMNRTRTFLHVQDMQPTPQLAPLTLAEMNIKPPYLAKTLGGRPVIFLPEEHQFNPVFRTELFRQRLGRIIENIHGLDLVCNNYATATQANPGAKHSQYYVHGMVFEQPVAEGETPVIQVSALVTLVKKSESTSSTNDKKAQSSDYKRIQSPPSRPKQYTVYNNAPRARVALEAFPANVISNEDSPGHTSLAQVHVDGRYFQLFGDGSITAEYEPWDRQFSDKPVGPAKAVDITPKVIDALRNACLTHFPKGKIGNLVPA